MSSAPAGQECEADAVAFAFDNVKPLKTKKFAKFLFGKKTESNEPFEEICKTGGTRRPYGGLNAKVPAGLKDSGDLAESVSGPVEQMQCAAAIDIGEGGVAKGEAESSRANKKYVLHPTLCRQSLSMPQHWT